MIQYPAVWTLSCSFSTAFWLPNIRKENLLTPGCIMAPNCLCIKPYCLDAPSRSSKPTMVSSRSPLKPTELPWSFMFWLPVLFFCIESCLWKTLFPSAFSSLLLENEFDLSSMALLVFPFSVFGGFFLLFSLWDYAFRLRLERERGGGERTRRELSCFFWCPSNCSAPLPSTRVLQTETEWPRTRWIRFLGLPPSTDGPRLLPSKACASSHFARHCGLTGTCSCTLFT